MNCFEDLAGAIGSLFFIAAAEQSVRSDLFAAIASDSGRS